MQSERVQEPYTNPREEDDEAVEIPRQSKRNKAGELRGIFSDDKEGTRVGRRHYAYKPRDDVR